MQPLGVLDLFDELADRGVGGRQVTVRPAINRLIKRSTIALSHGQATRLMLG